MCLQNNVQGHDRFFALDLATGARTHLRLPAELSGVMDAPVLSTDGRRLVFEYRTDDRPVRIGELFERNENEWCLKGMYGADGFSLVKPQISPDENTLLCYAERGSGGFEFAFLTTHPDHRNAPLTRVSTDGTAMPMISLAVDSSNRVALVPIRAVAPKMNGLAAFSLAQREWTGHRYHLPGSIEQVASTFRETPFVVLADRVISIRPDGQVSLPLPEAHQRTLSILTSPTGVGCFLVGTLPGGIGYCRWDFGTPADSTAWKVPGISHATLIDVLATDQIALTAFDECPAAEAHPYPASTAFRTDSQDGASGAVARLRTAPAPRIRDTDDFDGGVDDPFGSGADLTETEIGEAHTLVTLGRTTGAVYEDDEHTKSVDLGTGEFSADSRRTTAILPAPIDESSRTATGRMGSLGEDAQSPGGMASLGTQNEETVEVGFVDYNATGSIQEVSNMNTGPIVTDMASDSAGRGEEQNAMDDGDETVVPRSESEPDASAETGPLKTPLKRVIISEDAHIRVDSPRQDGPTDAAQHGPIAASTNEPESGRNGHQPPIDNDGEGTSESPLDEPDEVWTSAPQPMAVVSTPALQPLPVPERNATEILDFSEFRASGLQMEADGAGQPPMPDVDFDAWFNWVLRCPDPLREIQVLSSFRGDQVLNRYLGTTVTKRWPLLEADPDGHAELSLLILACAYAQAKEAQPHFLEVCEQTYRRIARDKTIPLFVEHLAMAAVRALQGSGRFSALAVAKEYDVVVGRIREAVEKGPQYGRKRLTQFSRKYDGALAGLLGKEKIEEPRRKPSSDAPKSSSPGNDIMAGYEFPDGDAEVSVGGESTGPVAAQGTHTAQPASREQDSGVISAFSVIDHDVDIPDTIDFGQPDSIIPRWLCMGLAAIAIVVGLIITLLASEVGVMGSVIGCLWVSGGLGFVGGSTRGLWGGGLSYLVSGISLVGYGWLGVPPAWLLPSGILCVGVLATVVGLVVPLKLLNSRGARLPF